MSFWHDERGTKSMGRLLLVVALLFTGALIALDASTPLDVPDPAWALLGTIFTGLLAWVAGPRVTQHLAGVASGIAQAKRSVPFSGAAPIVHTERFDDEL